MGGWARSAGSETWALSAEGLRIWWERTSLTMVKGGHRVADLLLLPSCLTQTPPIPHLQPGCGPRVLGAGGGSMFLDGVKNLRYYNDLPSPQRAWYMNRYSVYLRY